MRNKIRIVSWKVSTGGGLFHCAYSLAGRGSRREICFEVRTLWRSSRVATSRPPKREKNSVRNTNSEIF
jgi:hypothetical protein